MSGASESSAGMVAKVSAGICRPSQHGVLASPVPSSLMVLRYTTVRAFMTAIVSTVTGSSSAETASPRARGAVHPQLEEARRNAELLERKLKASEEEHGKLQEVMGKLQAENQDITGCNNKLAAEVDSLRAANESADEQYGKILKEKNEWKAAHERLKDQREQEVLLLNDQARKDLQVAQKMVERLTHDLQRLRTAYTNKESLLNTRTSELRAAEAFLDKSDTVSYGDVQRMLEHLNAQIFQLTALITDKTAFCDGRPHGQEMEASYKKIEQWLGQPLAELLYLSPHTEDPTWVQTALQATAVEFAAWIINAWHVSLDDTLNSLLTNIHRILFEQGKGHTAPRVTGNSLLVLSAEPQAISARWRVLSRRCARELASSDTVAEATEHLLDSLHRILRISGAGGIRDSKSWGAAFADKARDIVEQCMAVQKAIGEDVASSDFQIICPSVSELYDATIMEDVNDCGRNKRPTPKDGGGLPVLCTLEFGLRRFEKLEAGGSASEIQVATVMKAKVALQDQLQ